jgi:hypothetical protein
VCSPNSSSSYHATQGRPCFFTIFASSDIKLHPTHVSRVDAILETHMGELLAPPASLERFNEIGPFVSQDIEVGSWCYVAVCDCRPYALTCWPSAHD